MGIDVPEGLARVFALLSLERTNQDTVGREEIGDGCALGQKLGVGQNVKAAAGLGVGLEDSAHRLGGAAWHGRLFDDDFGRTRNLGNATRRELDVAMTRQMRYMHNIANLLEIGGESGTDTRLFGGCVDRDKDEVGLLDAFVDIGREKEVAAARLTHDVLEAGLVDGKSKVFAVPRVNTRLVEVDDGDLDVGALESDHRACRAACNEMSTSIRHTRSTHRHSQHQCNRSS